MSETAAQVTNPESPAARGLVILCTALVSLAAVASDEWPVLKGTHLGQEPPGMTPVVFAPGLISLDDERELNAVYSPDGRIFMFW